MICAVKIEWTEYERGWGCRPDGTSLYSDMDRAKAHIDRFYEGQPKDHVPYCYSKPSEPKIVEVTKEKLNAIKRAEKKGQVFWDKH